jgi:hypothetical protein
MFATSNVSALSDSVQQIKDAISDFRNSSVLEEAFPFLERIVYLFDIEPLSKFLISVLPTINFRDWWNELNKNGESSGIFVTSWPHDCEERIAIQVELCRMIVREKEKDSLRFFTDNYCNPWSHLKNSDLVAAFVKKVLDPLVRDIDRLIALRPVPPILLEAMRNFPLSGDETLDDKLQEACRKFKDPAPQSLQDATEKLWDSFERIKTLHLADKKKSIVMLLEQATEDQLFRDRINNEMSALTEIGNKFQIRHFEIDKLPFNQKQLEYLFHRLYSLIRFLLLARNEAKEKSLSD